MKNKSRKEKRKEALAELLNDDSCLFIKNPANIRYLTGFTGTNGLIYMEKDTALLISDPRYGERCYKEVKNFEVLITANPFHEILNRCASKKTIFVEYPDLSISELTRIKELSKDIEVKDVSHIIMKFRAQKDEEEIKWIKESSKINKRAFEKFLDFIIKNIGKITEMDAAVELEYIMRKEGSERPYFPVIVASGERASVPHAKPSDNKINYGNGILIDFGSVKEGYSTDETVSIFAGKVDEEYRRVWEILRDAKKIAIESIKIGENMASPEKRAREFLSKFGLEKFFVHSIGHGIGLEVHEYPKLSNSSNEIFEEGMIFTIEPGIYINGKFGIRLEDVVYLSSHGIEVLTEIKKEEILCV